eukprot:jgi/Ulvmu1/1180/UM108_0008.1
MIIAYDEKAHLRVTTSESQADQDDLSVTLTKDAIPSAAISRSPVLKCALESQGDSALPVTQPALRLWLAYAGREDSLALDSCCTILKVAMFLQDDESIRAASLRLAHAYRTAFRQDLSAHRDLFAVATRRPTDLKTDCFFPNLPNSFPRTPGPHLSAVLAPLATLNLPELTSVADHLALHEALLGPIALRAAALTCHLHEGRLDIVGALDANVASTPLHYAVAALAPALALGVCPEVTALRVPAWALRRGECLAPLVPHLAHLRHLTVVGTDGGVHSNRVGRFLAALESVGNPGLETFDVCTCRYSRANPHPSIELTPPKGPASGCRSVLRGYLCLSSQHSTTADTELLLEPPCTLPLLSMLRSVNLAMLSHDAAASLPALPLGELTCMRLCVSSRHSTRHRTRSRDAAAALAAIADTVAQARRLRTLHLDMSLHGEDEEMRPLLETLVAATAACSALRSLTLHPRWHVPAPVLWMLPLSALGATLEHLAAPPCFELLQKLPELSALEFTTAVDDVTPAMMHVLLQLRRLRTLALVNELTFDTYDVERSAHSEALDQLQSTCAVIGSCQDIWSRSVEGFYRRSHACRCWDPCGHREAVSRAAAKPDAVTMVVHGDTEGRAEAAGAQHPQRRSGGLWISEGGSDGGAECPSAVPVDLAVGVWPELAFMRGLRHVRLLVRAPTNRDRDMMFWSGVAALPELESLELTGLPAAPGVSGFLRMLAGHSKLMSLVLHGKETHPHELLATGAAIAALPALRAVCLDADICDVQSLHCSEFAPCRGAALSEDDEWELEAVRHALTTLCERWKAALTEVVLQQPHVERLQARVRCTPLARF